MGKVTDPHDDKGRLKCECKICEGNYYHRLDTHLRKVHKIKKEDYLAEYPGEQLVSDYILERLKEKKEKPKKSKKEIDKDAPFKIGVAELKLRVNLSDKDLPFVPKYDEQWITDEKQMQDLEDLAVGIQDRENIYIGGPTGAGKSGLVLQLAAILNQPALRVQLKRDFKVSEFVGKPELIIDKDGNQVTQFVEGVLPFCMQRNFWLLLDEYDQAHPDVHMAMQAVLEGQDLVLSEDYGRVVKRSPSFRVIATANTFGHGDDTGLYAGAKVQNEATLDRFETMLHLTYAEKDTEIKILQAKSQIKVDTIKKMVEVAHGIRKANNDEECSCTFSTRRLIAWARKTQRYEGDARRASRVSILNRLDREDSIFVDNIIQRYFGGEIT